MASLRPRRADLPEGTVTLLFTDIEGSTQLLHRLGARYTEVQDTHRRLLRDAFTRYGGDEVDTQGDAFMVVFRSTSAAAAAAAEAQLALASESWPDRIRVPVRMGLHTGEPELGAEGYVGIDVVRASRICGAAHGGQILLSQTTRDLLAEAGLRSIDLGQHRLKDITEPERLYQLVAGGLEESFPPLRTLGGATLPALHHRLVGRRNDLAEIEALLAQPDVRLVTITGPGGAGKSRLALEAAASAGLSRPVHLVGLAPVSDSSFVLAEIARAVGARESPARPLTESIADTLRGTRTLLFLDNLEHLAPAALEIAKLLDLVPDLEVLTTSRVPLRLSGEHVLPLAPLAVDDAATLFVELAAARGVVLRNDALTSVREICRRLDCLPLAIELVAARLVVLPPARILQALDEGLALDMEGPIDLPERQRTLRATIAWSYGLLTNGQQELHDALGVFAGGCTLDDARAIARAGRGFLADLESLVAWSLVRSDVADGDVRLSMLETVREDAMARLAAEGSLDELRKRHADRFLELASFAETELSGPSQAEWLDRLESELDNFRLAFDWCFTSGRVEDGLRALSSLSRFWRAHGHVSEARRWLSLGLALADDVAPDVRADALWTAGRQAAAQSDLSAEVPLLEAALELFLELGRTRDRAFALAQLGWISLQQGDSERAREVCEDALVVARASGDARAISSALIHVADVFSAHEDHEHALAALEDALAIRRTLEDPLLVADSTYNLGISAFENGEIERAREAFEESFAIAHELGDVLHTAAAGFMLAELDLLAGDVEQVEKRIMGSLAIYTEVESNRDRAECLVVLAGLAVARGSFEDAARLFGAAEALRGASPVNRFERPVIDRFERTLETALPEAEREKLRAEGARLGTEVVPRDVVLAGTYE
ncbi:MAG: tetratricopeptide repeat protein [Actinobacteria bacterium]|nr:tetratricopeptide repeat protein [Actinomycetota bacterium]